MKPAASTTFVSASVNDDVSTTRQDSALDLEVPGAPSTSTTFYFRVLDWRGDARPDMAYGLILTGVLSPLQISNSSLIPEALGLSYSQQLTSVNATGTTAFNIVAGSLPPGLTVTSGSLVSGAATTVGSFPFTVQVTDASTPPQNATANFTIQVVTPVAFVSSATFTDACLNQPYTFALQTSGGIQPIFWGINSSVWPAVNLNQSTGLFSGTPTIAGTFTGTLNAFDATTHGVFQTVSLTVKSCP